MFSLSSTVQPQVTVPLSHLINAFHTPKNTSVSLSGVSVSQNQHRDVVPEHEAPSSECMFSDFLTKLNIVSIGKGKIFEGYRSMFMEPAKRMKKSLDTTHNWHICPEPFSLSIPVHCGFLQMPIVYDLFCPSFLVTA
ncbi:YME1L1 isoform 1 [Pan troglodytes]|uniref:YME1L1 isoform 1 n=1 Tax=Pan troglodytes TaxID=9598 RepID=A0A2J8MNE3_PANTR|nr:YME1L1 isoform 1 [Pan troglodytes]